jgi:Spy/CpxP family protein refolding chaperone
LNGHATFHPPTENTACAADTKEVLMKTKSLIITALAVAVLATPGFSVAQNGPGGPGGGQGGFGGGGHGGFGGHGGLNVGMLERMMPRLVEYLDLSQDQQDQIQAILDEELPAITDLRDQLRAAREEFMETNEPGEFDESALRAFLEQQSPIRIDLEVAAARTLSRFFNVLTPEQREQLEKLRDLRGPRGPRRGGSQVKP